MPRLSRACSTCGVHAVHVVALLVGDHFQGQLVVIPQEERPLAGFGNRGRLLQDVHDGLAVLHAHGHEKPRHEREMESHVALVAAALAKVGGGIFGPLIGLAQQHAVAIIFIHMLAEPFQKGVRLGQVLATGVLAFVEVRHGVQPQAVHPQVEPEVHHFEQGFVHGGRGVVQVGLMGEEPMPVIGIGRMVPVPIGVLDVLEDDAGVVVFRGGVAPDIKIAPAAAGPGPPGALKPRMLVGSVVEHQFGDDPQPPAVRLAQKCFEIRQRAVPWMHRAIIGDVVTVVLERRRIKRQQPDRCHAEVLDVIEFLRQAAKIPVPSASLS